MTTPDLSWIDAAANGESFRVPENYDRDQCVPNDRLAGVVTVATPTSLASSAIFASPTCSSFCCRTPCWRR